MRKTFPGYYRPSEPEFRRLWDRCIFVLDANVLLNLYRYSDVTRKKLLDILLKIQSRLWVHQAALEYQRNRLEVISAQREAYKQIEQLLTDTRKKLEGQLKGYKRHPLIDADRLLTSINGAFEAEAAELGKVREKHPDLLLKDDVRDALTKLLDGKVGQPYTDERLKQIYKEGEERYAKLRPPGYRDGKSKNGDAVFGDLVLWFQVIDKAASDNVPVVIVTDDVKEDWWWRHEGKIVGPAPELVDEIRTKAKVDFYMYVPDQFMVYARDYLKEQIDQGAIDEIREVRALDEQRRLRDEKAFTQRARRLREYRHNLIALESEASELGAEISSVNRRLGEIAIEPADLRDTSERRALTATLLARVEEMEARRHLLEDRRNELAHHLAEGSLVLHGDSGRERIVRMRDGTIRRVQMHPGFSERDRSELARTATVAERREDTPAHAEERKKNG
jgi:PIN domain-containing protein